MGFFSDLFSKKKNTAQSGGVRSPQAQNAVNRPNGVKTAARSTDAPAHTASSRKKK